MAELKTKKNDASVTAFLEEVADERRRADCFAVLGLMRAITGCEPKMWGPSIVGFGEYHYVYASGHEGDWMLTGFSPRKQDLTVYLMAGTDRHQDLMANLGKHRTGKSCLYLKRLADVDMEVLRELVKRSVEHVKAICVARGATSTPSARAGR